MTGVISTVRGPLMFLPDPRTQVIVKRKLTPTQCALWYPGNKDVADYNNSLTEKAVEKSLKAQAKSYNYYDDISVAACLDSHSEGVATAIKGAPAIYSISASCEGASSAITNLSNSLAALESNASISRGTSYTKPRTITLDNAYDGVVAINIWSGYAINVISKDGTSEVIRGPQTVLLDYDQTLGTVTDPATGKPTVYLKCDGIMVTKTFEFETKDLCQGSVNVNYRLRFDTLHQNEWFNESNYVNYMNNTIDAALSEEIKKYSVEDFYQNYTTIVSSAIMGDVDAFTICPVNGMYIEDCLVHQLLLGAQVSNLINKYHDDLIKRSFELKEAEARAMVAEQRLAADEKEAELRNAELLHALELQRQEATTKLEVQRLIDEQKMASRRAEKEAERDLQIVLDAIQDSTLLREKKKQEQDIAYKLELANVEKAKQTAYAETVAKILNAVGPDLVAALTSKSNADVTIALAEALAPYALAGENENVSDVINKITRGLPLEDAIKNISKN
jgi:major vault protein